MKVGNPNKRMIHAILEGDTRELERSLTEGAEPNKLHRYSHQETGTYALSLVAKMSKQGNHSHEAAYALAEILLNHEGKPTLSAIINAAGGSDTRLLTRFLSDSTNARALGKRPDVFGAAATNYQLGNLELLTDTYGEIPSIFIGDTNVLFYICRQPYDDRQIPVIEYLVKHGKFSLDERGTQNMTALHESGSAEMTQYLLGKGLDPNSRTKTNTTALFYAHSYEQIDILLEAGAQKDALSITGRGAIWTMVSRQRPLELIEYALERGISCQGETIDLPSISQSLLGDMDEYKEKSNAMIQAYKTRGRLIGLTSRVQEAQGQPRASKTPEI